MTWERKETGHYWNPYYYEYHHGNLTLTLMPPYESDPWTARLSKANKETIHKENFRLRHNDRSDDKALWESINDLEQAQEQAFIIMEEYLKRITSYWDGLLSELNEMKEGG